MYCDKGMFGEILIAHLHSSMHFLFYINVIYSPLLVLVQCALDNASLKTETLCLVGVCKSVQ